MRLKAWERSAISFNVMEPITTNISTLTTTRCRQFLLISGYDTISIVFYRFLNTNTPNKVAEFHCAIYHSRTKTTFLVGQHPASKPEKKYHAAIHYLPRFVFATTPYELARLNYFGFAFCLPGLRRTYFWARFGKGRCHLLEVAFKAWVVWVTRLERGIGWVVYARAYTFLLLSQVRQSR